jgi:hypothetical protein
VELSAPTERLQAALLGLLRRLAAAQGRRELAFIAVNEAHALAPYRQAALWLDGHGVSALSGVVAAEDNAPYVQFLKALFRRQARSAATRPHVVRADELGEDLAAQWGSWLPAQGLLVPLPGADRATAQGYLLFARQEPWTPLEADCLGEFADQLGIALRAHRSPRLGLERRAPRGVGRALLASWPLRIAVLLMLLSFVPVPLSVLAPAELVAANPDVIRSPLDGVVERVLVEPNATVAAGDALFEFDRAAILAQLQVARRSLDTLQAEYRQHAQLALADSDSRAAMALVAGRIEEQRAEVTYLEEMSARGRVLADRAGVVIFDDPSSWTGRPVVTGERVMLIARDTEVELEAWLAPDDLIPLARGAPVRLYLNSDPLNAVAAQLRYIAYEAVQRPDGSFAYRVRAAMEEDGSPLRIGQRGTAKLSGESVSLGYWLLRKPLAALRATLGW